jgi:hypothetical protein
VIISGNGVERTVFRSPIAVVDVAFVVRLDRTGAEVRANASGMGDDELLVAAYIDAAAAALGMALSAERRAGVIAAMTRLASFAADVAAVELGADVEIAGVFVP